MLARLVGLWNTPPARALYVLTLVALVPRLIAVFLSPGYFAHDDHFLIIEAAASWVAGHDYNYWLPWNQGPNPTPSGHSSPRVAARARTRSSTSRRMPPSSRRLLK